MSYGLAGILIDTYNILLLSAGAISGVHYHVSFNYQVNINCAIEDEWTRSFTR
jgi:hypothetical protein